MHQRQGMPQLVSGDARQRLVDSALDFAQIGDFLHERGIPAKVDAVDRKLMQVVDVQTVEPAALRRSENRIDA